ncbi:uncharacterized protein DNG_08744 [Cephalotrichum gorgonifer]|uniref:Uncharacterized protein n=1 Tax=Cephalotrichum gorgonifer TaxID=2041049 RepID=A0AAE8N735_9PEZI|nr:uncharacterized protein DNG_08744 [Cephalotrichum gorgonifer]
MVALDPWNVAGVVVATSKLAWEVGRFWKDVPSAPQKAKELRETIEILHQSAQSIRDGFVAPLGPDAIEGEEQNRKLINDLNNKCVINLYKLMDILPKLPADPGMFTAVRTHFVAKLEEDNVRDMITEISTCNTALQVQLQLLMYFKMERGRQPERTTIQGKWNQVLGEADDILSHRPSRSGEALNWDDCLGNFVTSIRAITEPGSLSEGRSPVLCSTPGPLRRDSHVSQFGSIAPTLVNRRDSDSALGIVDDPEDARRASHAIPNVLGGALLNLTLDKLDKCMYERNYYDAEILQRRVIEYRARFPHDTPVPIEVMWRDEIKLAEIYRCMGSFDRAEGHLRRVVGQLSAENLDKPGLKDSMLAKLYHDLGRICVDAGKSSAGCEYLSEAFELLVKSSAAEATPLPLLRSVGTMLYGIYFDTGMTEAAQVLDAHAEELCGLSLKTLAWCQKQGFDTEHDTFRFDECDTRVDSPVKGMTPLHVAVKEHKDEILGHMLTSGRLNLEVTEDRDGATPFLLACFGQDTVIVKLLLQHGAIATATDNLQRNGLHLCQSSTGGTGVARLLIEGHPAIKINAQDIYRNTALHLAASAGNSKMVLLLLNHRADPNICDPRELRADPNICGQGGYSPLMGAVQARSKSRDAKLEILKALLDAGADVSQKYWDGQTAADLANDGEVRKMLQGWAKREPRPKLAKRFTLPWKKLEAE